MSIIGLLLVNEPKQINESKDKQRTLELEELPSLNAKEVLKTTLFYKVLLGEIQNIFYQRIFV